MKKRVIPAPKVTPFNWSRSYDAGMHVQPPRWQSAYMKWRGDDDPPAQTVRPDATLSRRRGPTPKQEWFLIQQDTTKVKG